VGNIEKIHDLLQQHPPEALRLALLSAHYRKPLDWNADLVNKQTKKLTKLYKALEYLAPLTAVPTIPQEIEDALDDDLNTPLAITKLEKIEKDAREAAQKLKNVKTATEIINAYEAGQAYSEQDIQAHIQLLRFELVPVPTSLRTQSELMLFLSTWLENLPDPQTLEQRAIELKGQLLGAGLALGLLQQDPVRWAKGYRKVITGAADGQITISGTAYSEEAIEALIQERTKAKQNRDFARSDAIRDQLAAEGILLEDTAQGVRWKRA
jgi:cysteinyl-tRNA synthetase